MLRAHLFEEPVDAKGPLTVKKNVYVIPNAIVAAQFKPAPPLPRSDGIVTIAVMSRLAYRKGVDLLVATAPRICALFPNVRLIIGMSSYFTLHRERDIAHYYTGGDGPKLVDLLQMREKHMLQDRIELLGSVRPANVQSVRSFTFLSSLPSILRFTDMHALRSSPKPKYSSTHPSPNPSAPLSSKQPAQASTSLPPESAAFRRFSPSKL